MTAARISASDFIAIDPDEHPAWGGIVCRDRQEDFYEVGVMAGRRRGDDLAGTSRTDAA